MKSAGKLVVDAASRHALEGRDADVADVRIYRARIAVQQQIERRRMRELGRTAETTMLGVEQALRAADDVIDNLRVHPIGVDLRERFGAANHVHHRVRLLVDFRFLLAESIGNGQQHALESRTSVVILRREIRSSKKRLAFWGKKRRERPSALSGHRLHCGLVSAVDIGALIAIYLDRDIFLVHDLRHFGIVV